MGYQISSYNLYQFFELIKKDYSVFAVEKENSRNILKKYSIFSNLALFSGQTVIPFKKILIPNNKNKVVNNQAKIALVGLHICDVHALHIILDQFLGSAICPRREDIFIIATKCKPNRNCFCDLFGANKLDGFDIYLENISSNRLNLFTGTERAEQYINLLKFKKYPKIKPQAIKNQDIKINDNNLEKIIENRERFEDFWQKISNNCFGCGACSVVCPLCFCFRQEYQSNLDNSQQEFISWDSCFAKDFFEIQKNFDFKPKNVDRLYNWYHHKFVRGKKELDRYLCVGCGRCIEACPAGLNIKKILSSLDNQIAKKLKEE